LAQGAITGLGAGIRRGLEGTHTGVSLRDVASRNFTVVRENERCSG